MAKGHYRFDPENMNFDRVPENLGTRIRKGIIYVTGALVMALILNVVYNIFFDSPRERQVRRENEELMRQYAILQERKSTVDTVLKEIMLTDENIYKLIFETEPVEKNTLDVRSTPYEQLKLVPDRTIVFGTASKLDSLLEKSRQDKLSYDILRIKSEDKAAVLRHIPAIQPIENKDLTRTASGYGYRIHPIYKIRRFHAGMDYTAPVGTLVVATGDGVVEVAERSRRGSGNRVVIDHGFGYKSVYAHLNEINTRRGREVSRGEVIGTVGNTGLSTAPHLHYEVWMNGEPVNPINFFFLELDANQYEKMIMISKKSGQSFD
jgi:murein DD-endopeptidase MepM/ murein hydrolase activator NlpD